MNPTAPPTSTNLRQRILDAVVTGLRTILVSNNYETDLGLNVCPWQDHALAAEQLPALVLRDTGIAPIEGSSGVCVPYKLSFEAALVPPAGDNAPAYARKMWADVLQWIRLNRRLADPDVLTVTTEYEGDDLHVDQKANTFAGISVHFFALFKMRSLDPYTPAP